MIADLEILQKTTSPFVYPLLTLSTNGHSLQGSSQRDHCGEQTKGSNDLDNFAPKKSGAFSRMKGPPVPAGKRPLRDYDNHHTIPWDIPEKKPAEFEFIGIGSSPHRGTSFETVSREAFRLPKTNIFETWNPGWFGGDPFLFGWLFPNISLQFTSNSKSSELTTEVLQVVYTSNDVNILPGRTRHTWLFGTSTSSQ